jgi:molybdopterin-guanine dinucleotide biosynthesis protein A
MGQDKALLLLDRQPLLIRVLTRLARLSDDLIVAANMPGQYADVLKDMPIHVHVVSDAVPDSGPLGGMCAGLLAAQHEQAVIVACDMPFLNTALLRWMIGLLSGHDVVIPHVAIQSTRKSDRIAQTSRTNARAKDADLHPLHAVYSRACVEVICGALDRGARSLGAVVDGLRVRAVEADEMAAYDSHLLSVRNVNTPEEFSAAQQLIRDERC